MIIGCDFHTRYQQIAMMDEATGELTERRLEHESGEADAFYRNLQGPVRVGIEATGPIRWFERLLAELGHELWIGDAAKIRASEVRKQKTDERDARLILDLLLAKRFPRIWVPTPDERDLRQLLWHRHKLVCLRTMLGNQLHALAMSRGAVPQEKAVHQKRPTELSGVWRWVRGPAGGAKNFCNCSTNSTPRLRSWIARFWKKPSAAKMRCCLMTHPGIGPVTSLAFVLAIGPVTRFPRSKKIASYLGLNPSEESSGGRRRLGAISKQGNTMVRWLLIEAVYPAVRKDPELRQDYQRLKFRRGHAVAKVAIARKLAVRMYWMLRSGAAYAQLVRRQGSPGATLVDASPSLG